jgi:hypothetical protein
MTAAHPFTIRDSLPLRAMIGRGISFDSRSGLTQDLHLLRRAVLAPLLPGRYPETIVLDSNGRPSGFGQLSHRRGEPSSRLRFLAPKDLLTTGGGTGLIAALLRVAGRRQAQHILADAEDKSEECGFLRREGFVIYAREDIWTGAAPFPQPSADPPGALRPLLASDASGAHALYCSIVPALVHQVEGFPRPARGWRIFEEGELVGFFHLRSGPLGMWMEPFFHPGARHAASWIGAWLGALPAGEREPVYVCVRSYQDWLGSILRDFGFTLFSRRAVLVRRVVVPVPIPEGAPLSAVEKPVPQTSTFSAPVTHNGYDSATANHR